MAEYRAGDRVEVDISAGIVPGAQAEPEWEQGTIEERLPNGFYRVRLEHPIAGRAATKDAASEHIRPHRSLPIRHPR
jgi:hypothetical protein